MAAGCCQGVTPSDTHLKELYNSKFYEKGYIAAMSAKKEPKKLRAAFFKKGRRKENSFVVEGERAFAELVKSGWRTLKVYADSKNLPRIRRLTPPPIPVEEIASRKLAELAQTETPPGILALVEKPVFKLEELADEKRILILDNLRDPGNVGTLLRTARSLGWNGAILLRGTAELFSPKVVRSTAGALFHMKICTDVATEEALKFLKQNGFSLWVADAHMGVSPEKGRGLIDSWPLAGERSGENGQAERQTPAKMALVIGSEAAGVSAELKAAASQRVKIPLSAGAESLNAAVAGGILMYFLAKDQKVP